MRCVDIRLQKGISHLLNISTTFLLMYDGFPGFQQNLFKDLL